MPLNPTYQTHGVFSMHSRLAYVKVLYTEFFFSYVQIHRNNLVPLADRNNPPLLHAGPAPPTHQSFLTQHKNPPPNQNHKKNGGFFFFLLQNYKKIKKKKKKETRILLFLYVYICLYIWMDGLQDPLLSDFCSRGTNGRGWLGTICGFIEVVGNQVNDINILRFAFCSRTRAGGGCVWGTYIQGGERESGPVLSTMPPIDLFLLCLGSSSQLGHPIFSSPFVKRALLVIPLLLSSVLTCVDSWAFKKSSEEQLTPT